MKKLIVVMAAVAMACASQAATIKWGTGTVKVPGTTTNMTKSNISLYFWTENVSDPWTSKATASGEGDAVTYAISGGTGATATYKSGVATITGGTYDKDFVKHADPALLGRIRLLWNNIPAQLAKENKKFIYKALKEGARGRSYEEALQWLDDAGMIHQVFRAETPRMPLKSYEDSSAFKLYMHDVGLLGAISALPPSAILEGNSIFTNFKGAMTEQFVLQELIASGVEPSYWSSERGDAEVDFLVQGTKAIYPVEVKAERNLKAKSLKAYRETFGPPVCYRTSLSPFSAGKLVRDMPLYAVLRIAAEISE